MAGTDGNVEEGELGELGEIPTKTGTTGFSVRGPGSRAGGGGVGSFGFSLAVACLALDERGVVQQQKTAMAEQPQANITYDRWM